MTGPVPAPGAPEACRDYFRIPGNIRILRSDLEKINGTDDESSCFSDGYCVGRPENQPG